jgi:hypothetical protein
VVSRDVPVEAELIKKLLRFVLPPHHRTISRSLKTETRESPNKPRRNQNFFNGIFKILHQIPYSYSASS